MSQERTEAPTPRRLQELRDQGNVPRSQDVTGALALLAGVIGLQQVAPTALDQAVAGMRAGLMATNRGTLAAEDVGGLLFNLGVAAITALGGAILPAATVGLAVGLLQSGGSFAIGSLRPRPERLNPLAWLRRLFSAEGLVGLLWPTLKLIAVCVAVQGPLRGVLTKLPVAVMGGLGPLLNVLGGAVIETARNAAIALVVLGAFDVFYRRWQFLRQARMSRQELRDEYRQSEGDPTLRGRLRALQRRLAKGRMLQQVPRAQVVVTNPTHYAVALVYQMGKTAAPEVVAKGADLMAQRIIAKAREHRVPIVPNPPLARALYGSVEVGQPIPTALYEAVAEVLAYVYTQRRRS